MKISDKQTANILIKARTNSEWDSCECALVHISDEWKKLQAERLDAVKLFKDDYNFQSLRFYSYSAKFYQYGGDEIPDIEELLGDKDWSFVELGKDEQDKFVVPENNLDCYRIVIYRDGNARYEAFGKHTNEEFWTNKIPLQQIIEQIVELQK